MKERPILLNGPMVRAILNGSKTQTRRVITMPASWDCIVYADYGDGWWPFKSDDGESPTYDNNQIPLNCPYGYVGDRLWVRETHAQVFEIDIPPGRRVGPIGTAGSPARPDWKCRYVYLADGPMPNVQWHHVGDSQPVRWTASTRMPRSASRILLEVVAVRVERLQDISEADARAEGVESLRSEGVFWRDYSDPQGADTVSLTCTNARDSYFTLWDGINGAGSWDANPWVWVVEFKRVAP